VTVSMVLQKMTQGLFRIASRQGTHVVETEKRAAPSVESPARYVPRV
jgi:hypothetical protein